MPQTKTRLNWEIGTAYDFFISLVVLHEPEDFGLRPSWAQSVRSKLSAENRKVLETANTVITNPLCFIHNLEKPQDALTALSALEALTPSKILDAIFFSGRTPEAFKEALRSTAKGRRWTHEQREIISDHYVENSREVTLGFLDALRALWEDREKFGLAYTKALRNYYEVFFKDEEKRILPILKQSLSHAQMRSGSRPLAAMLEELSAGVRYMHLESLSKIYLAPSFWGTPYLFYDYPGENEVIMVFGARPDEMPLIPGDSVPDYLISGLSALSDGTRLRILRTLAQTPQTAAQLSRSLRLRPPTVARHLTELRVAGLVQINFNPDGERQYATRFEGFDSLQDLLHNFVRGD
ncbi:MAG: winged helix-turn-helix domain-containing protein [Anaerolineaceae bacterium]|nr:winged helix-turn-helix domain-containing protein [Anaerolineaceae bacterium]